MLKGYFVYGGRSRSGTNTSVGVNRKLEDQAAALGEDFDISMVAVAEPLPFGKIKSWTRLLPHADLGWGYDEALSEIENADFVYIRKIFFEKKFLEFLKAIKEKNKNCLILLEIPTYPYDGQMVKRRKYKLLLWKEKIYRKKLKGLVERIVTFSSAKEIFGVKTISTVNGISYDRIPLSRKQYEKGELNLMAVAHFQTSHGYERVIRGLSEYKKKEQGTKVTLHMVGGGSELPLYKKLVKDLELENEVIFYGPKFGEELTDILNRADVALGCFGLYKDGISEISALKTADYIARGIPVVSGGKERPLSDDLPEFYFEFPNDSSSVDIEKIIEFANKCYEGRQTDEVRKGIRDYAEKRLDIVKTMEPVASFIKVRHD